MGKEKNTKLTVFPLSPRCDIEEAETYKSVWEKVESNSDIRNIAITGDFGIGKSSILHSIVKKRFRFISVYGFLEKETNANWEHDLLTQLLLCGNGKDDSNLVPPSPKPLRWIIVALWAVLVSLCVFTLTCTEAIMVYADNEHLAVFLRNILTFINNNRATVIVSAYAVLGCLIITALCAVVFLLLRKRLTIKDISVEFGHIKASGEGEQKISCLDIYRPKLIESLGRCKKTFIFEDMDRLEQKECLSLMYRLHNLNRDANAWKYERNRCNVFCRIAWLGRYISAEWKETHSQGKLFKRIVPFFKGLFSSKRTISEHFKPVRFAYVVNDSVFCEIKDSTTPFPSQGSTPLFPSLKFFDFIIPVVPSLSRLNAAMYLTNEMSKVGFTDRALIEAVAPYLYDHRLVNNILNEYQIMRNVELKRQGIDNLNERAQTHLMALVIYKNLMPADYKMLRNGKSKVFPKRGENEFEHITEKTDEIDNVCVKKMIERALLIDDSLHFVGYVTDKKIQEIFEGNDDEENKALAFRLYEEECFRYFTKFASQDHTVQEKKKPEEQAKLIGALEEIDFAAAAKSNSVEQSIFIVRITNLIKYLCVNGYTDFGWFCQRNDQAQELRQNPEYILKKKIKDNILKDDPYNQFHETFENWR